MIQLFLVKASSNRLFLSQSMIETVSPFGCQAPDVHYWIRSRAKSTRVDLCRCQRGAWRAVMGTDEDFLFSKTCFVHDSLPSLTNKGSISCMNGHIYWTANISFFFSEFFLLMEKTCNKIRPRFVIVIILFLFLYCIWCITRTQRNGKKMKQKKKKT